MSDQRCTPEDQAMLDQSFDEFFETLFENLEQGKMSIEDIENFFPEEVKQQNE